MAPRLRVSVLVLLGLALVGCGGGGDGPTGTGSGPTGEQLAEVAAERDSQADWFQQMAAMAAMTDTATAIADMAGVIAADPDVEWARNSVTGVSFRWKSGRPGFVVLDPRSGPRSGESMTGGKAGSAPRKAAATGPAAASTVVPAGRKAIYLAPAYSEFELWDNTLIESADTSLVKVGLDRFVLYEDNRCTLALIRSLSTMDVGVLRISSHGTTWPSPEDIQEVYLITGEVPTEASDKANWKEINETYSVATGNYAGETRYFVTDDFFAANVDFGTKRPFVSLGFCFGNLGNWPETLTGTCKAGATLGWDWAVFTHRDAPRIEWFFSDMCDTSRAEPLTLGAWFPTINREYRDDQDGKDVHLGYHGNPQFAMFAALRLTGIEPAGGQPGDTVTLTGTGFGTARGTVRFDAIEASAISAWTDTEIRVQVPDGLNEGEFQVTVKVGELTSNALPFTVLGDLLAKLHECTLIDVSFVAEHEMASGGTTEALFNPSLRNIVWNGTSFTGFDSTSFGGETYTARFSGSVAGDGRTLSFTWTTDRRAVFENGTTTVIHSSATVSNLPYLRDRREFGNQEVTYAAPAGGVAGFIGQFDYSTTTTNVVGVVIDADSYVTTRWGAGGVEELLEVTLVGLAN